MKKINIILLMLAMVLFTGQLVAQTYTGGGNPQSIPVVGTGGFPCAGGPTTSVANVPLVGTVGGTYTIDKVQISLTHTWDSDLEIDLISPGGATVWDLSSDNGGAGNDYINTMFVDGAPSITTGAPPFTGTFQAEQGPMNTGFAGDNVNGNWTLSICDDAGGDTGTLNLFEITFGQPCAINVPAPVVVSNDPGQCSANVTLIASAPNCAAPLTNDYNGGGADASDNYPVGTTTVTWTSGLSSNSTTVTVNDDEAPTLTCPGDQTIHLDPGACEQVISWEVLVDENCPGAPATVTTNNTFDVGSIINSVACPGGGYQTLNVYDLPALGITGEVAATSVDFGVFQVFGAPTVTANIYTIAAIPGATFSYADLTLVATGSTTFAAGGNSVQSIPVTGTIPANSVTVIELVTPSQFANGFIPGYNNAGLNSGPTQTYLASTFCNVPDPTVVGNILGGFTDVAMMQLNVLSADIEATQTGGLPLTSGSAFPIGGPYTMSYEAVDNSGNVGTCSWNITVVEYVPTSDDITCNDLVHITLDDETCSAIVGADQILEGNNYGCYDNYEVTFKEGPNAGQPVVLNSSHLGQTIKVQVTSPGGNLCWGQIFVEDKTIPELVCEDVTIPCSESTTPGAAFTATTDEAFATLASATGSTSEDLVVGGFGSIDDVNVTVVSDHTWVGDLVITITSPSGTSVELMNNIGGPGFGCAGDGLDLVFDDAAANTYMDLDGTCGNNPAAAGTFQPLQALSAFNGEPVNGTWTLTVQDLFGGDDGNFDVSLNLTASGSVPFPLPAGAIPLPAGNQTYTVLNFDPCGPATLTYVDSESGELCDLTQKITRVWTATDGSGNSTTCTQMINITPITIADVLADLPGDIELDCQDPVPAPIASGDYGCENIGITLIEEYTIPICEGSYKLIRKYLLVDWCTNETTEHQQIIKVLDTTGPNLAAVCPANLTISTSSNSCLGAYQFPTLNVSDNCGTSVSVSFAASAGTITGNLLTGLPVGDHTITVTATDDCGNESTCSYILTVKDLIAPIAICDEHTTVSIGTDGTAYINAHTFDDGSYDNCAIVKYDARRMATPCGPASAFGPVVNFSCCDVGSTVMVEFRVMDAEGNTNSCMVEVVVQDKIPATVVCPGDKDANCDADFLDDIVIGQPLPASAIAVTGTAAGLDNCTVTVTSNVINNTIECGEGVITIVWTATDGLNQPDQCFQFINVSNNDIFHITDTECNDFPIGQAHSLTDDVEWPCDIELTTCGFGLDLAGLAAAGVPAKNIKPQIFEGSCDNIAYGFHDQELTFGADDACLKILRKWFIIDWCQADDNQDPTQPGAGVWHYTQVIKVTNSEDPNITVKNLPSTICNFDPACGNATATFEITADDDCTDQDNLQISWAFSTGTTGSGTSATGLFANGSYSLTFTVNDGCDNEVELIHNFIVKDCKKPTPVCIFGIATTVMPSSGSVVIWATDFESGSSYDNCTAYENLHFSFSQDINDTHVTISCADVPADGLYPITLYVTDDEGNFDFCTTFINVQDPNGVCPNPTASISGTIENELQEVVEEVTVTLSDDNGLNFPVVTGTDGSFDFGMSYGAYDVTPEKDINYLNGVTTYDLVLISKHILGIEVLDSPYKWIAADANKSETITALDIVKLRALILHIDDELANNTSWRFVDQGYVFTNTNNPLTDNFNEFVALDGTTNAPVNFTAIKVGDVNGTASPNSLLGTDTRNFDGKLALQVASEKVAAGETFTVDFRAKNFNNIAGYQFTLGFENAEFVDVTSNLAGLSAANFGLTKLSEGVITTSWNDAKGVSVDDNEVLFSMTFIANADLNTTDAIAINSRYTESEAYNGSDLFDVVLEFNGTEVANGFELYQNTPNPFKAETVIGFNVPQAGSVTLKIFDVSGRILRLMEIDAAKGFNSVNVSRADLDAAGVLYYQLETATETATKKMIIVD